MTRQTRRPGNDDSGHDENVTRLLRTHYAPPSGAGYWDALESRIMTRVLDGGAAEWWVVLSGWTRAGAAAAAIAAIMAGALMLQARAAETNIAYEAVLSQPAVTTLLIATPSGDVADEPMPFRLP